MRTQIRNNPGMSSYFGGGYREYGLYQWNIKYYGFQDEVEIEIAVNHYFGSYEDKTKSFFWIDDLLGRTVKASIEGRSGGWFVIHEKLTKKELTRVDDYIADMKRSLADYLNDEREYRKSESLEVI